MKKDGINLQEKAGEKEPRSMLNSIASTQDALNKSTQKLAKHKRLKVIYTILLCVAIGFIWVSLLGPISRSNTSACDYTWNYIC